MPVAPQTLSKGKYIEIRWFCEGNEFLNDGLIPNSHKVNYRKVIYGKNLMRYEFRGKNMSMERDLIKEAYSTEKAWGLSTAIDIHGCNPEKIRDEAEIKRFIYELCEFIKMKRYGDCMVVRFGEGDMIGYSAVQLIETSLISAHFVDTSSAGYIDIFSCKYYRPEDALTFCKDFFEAKDANYNYLLRI